jgi:hypothetical protein
MLCHWRRFQSYVDYVNSLQPLITTWRTREHVKWKDTRATQYDIQLFCTPNMHSDDDILFPNRGSAERSEWHGGGGTGESTRFINCLSNSYFNEEMNEYIWSMQHQVQHVARRGTSNNEITWEKSQGSAHVSRYNYLIAVAGFERLVAGLSTWRPLFTPLSFHVDLWWTKWHWKRIFSEFFCFLCQYHSTVTVHTHISSWV